MYSIEYFLVANANICSVMWSMQVVVCCADRLAGMQYCHVLLPSWNNWIFRSYDLCH